MFAVRRKFHSVGQDWQAQFEELCYFTYKNFFHVDERLQFNPAQGTLPEVTLQMYEIYNELVIDLQQIPGLSNKYCSIEETARDGTVIKVICFLPDIWGTIVLEW